MRSIQLQYKFTHFKIQTMIDLIVYYKQCVAFVNHIEINPHPMSMV